MIPTPFFSVVVPCYSHERYVEETIKSLWAQRCQDFEIVAVNNGSPDRTGPLLDAMAGRSRRPMTVLHTSNQGAHAALNAGAAAARAPYLAFLNDDDAYHADFLDAFARAIAKCDGFAWGFSGVEPLDDRGRPVALDDVADPVRRSAIYRSRMPLDAARVLPRENSMVSSGNLVVRTDLFREIEGFRDFRFAHCWDLALRLLEIDAPFVVERPLYQYRIHGANAFDRGLTGEGARLAGEESDRIARGHRDRVAQQVRFMPFVGGSASDIHHREPDDARAVKVMLWAMARLRGIPRAYAVVRKVALLVRDARRAFHRRG